MLGARIQKVGCMTIKFKLFSRALSNGRRRLVVRVHNKTKASLFDQNVYTELSIDPKYWDKETERVSSQHSSHDLINSRIAEIKERRERLLTKFESNKISAQGVASQLLEKKDVSTLDDFISNNMRKDKTDVTYQNYVDKLKGFKKLIGHNGKLAFQDISNNLFQTAYAKGTKRQKEGTITSRSFNGYVSTTLAILKEAKFLGETDVVIDLPTKYKHLKKARDKNISITKNKGNTTEDLFNAIDKINTLQQWQSVAVWLLQFCLRGFYYGDLVNLKQTNIEDINQNKVGHLIQPMMSDKIYINQYRSKTEYPMYIHVFNYPTLTLIHKLKYSFVYTHIDKKLNGKSILASINDTLSLFDYDHTENSKFHNQMWKHFQRKTKKMNLKQKFARKTFNQYAQRLNISQDVRAMLLGQASNKLLAQHYDDNTIPELLKEVDEAHLEVLKLFKANEIMDKLLVKLKYLIIKDKLPEWILCQSVVHKTNKRLRVLVGFVNHKPKWCNIEGKFRKYFIQDKRGDDDYWQDLDTMFDDKVKERETRERVTRKLWGDDSKIYKDVMKQLDLVEKAEIKIFRLPKSEN